MDPICWWPRHSLRWQVAQDLRRSRVREPLRRSRSYREEFWSAAANPTVAIVAGAVVFAAWLALVETAPWMGSLGSLQSTLWQVQSGVLGLAVAVVVFGLQIGRETFKGRIVTLAPRLQAAVYWGLVLLAVTGLSLLLPIDSTRASWGNIVLLAATITWLVVVGAGVDEARRLTSSREQVHARVRRLARASEVAALQLLEARFSAAILRRELEPQGIQLSPWLDPVVDGRAGDIAFPADGTIRDIRTCQFYDALSRVRADNSPLRVSPALWRRVSRRQRLALLPDSTPAPLIRRLQRSVRIARNTSHEGPGQELEDLAEVAASSISDGSLTDAVLEAFDATLEAYARAWSPYVDSLTASHLPTALGGEGEAPLDAISRSLTTLVRSALRNDALGPAGSAMFFPVRAMQHAIQWRAPGYFRLLNLAAAFVYLSAEPGVAQRVQTATRERAWHNLADGLMFYIHGSRNVRGVDPGLLSQAETATRAAMLEVLRALMRVGDLGAFTEALRIWRIREADAPGRTGA